MATPAMNLTLPVVGVTPGSTAGTNIVDNFNIIDTHDHSTGKGVQIPTAGLNINAPLSFGTHKAFNLPFVQLLSQVSSPVGANDRPNLHVLNGNLYYTNASGTAVQITNAGSISGTSGSIGGLASPAAAQFSTNTFIWNADATTYGKHQLSDLLIYPFNSGATNFLTLKVGNSVTTWTMTLPDAAPSATEALNISSSGVVSTISYDGIGSGMTSTGANAIAETRTRSTGTTVGVGGIAVSNGCGAFVTANTTATDVTNLSVTITTSGRPVRLELITEDDSNESNVVINRTSSNLPRGYMWFVRGSSVIGRHELALNVDTSATENLIAIGWPPSAFAQIDFPSAGTYTYKIMVYNQNASSQFVVNYCKLVAYEL